MRRLLTTLAAVALVVVAASPASATSYRYWTYWHGASSGAWSFSPVGAGYRPPAGSVEGWRFAVSGTAASTAPRMAASFAVICAGRTASSGDKLVALVVDYGVATDAPSGERVPFSAPRTFCADVPSAATTYSILQQYSPGAGGVRSAGGLVCGIHGYPAQECGVVVTLPPAPKPTPRPTPAPAPTAHASHPAAGAAAPSTSAARESASASAASTTSTSGGAASAGTGTSPTDPSAGAETTFPAVQAMGAETPVASRSSGALPWTSVVGGLLVVALGAAAALRARRSRRSGRA